MDHWHFIKDSIIRSFPPIACATEESLLAAQEAFLLGEMDCWFGVESLESQEIIAVMTTKMVREDITGTKNMLIFSVATYQLHNADLWISGYKTLKAYAKSKGCAKIISFTDNPRVVNIAESLGADVTWHFIQLEV